jgi:hypothetical protein
MIDDKIEITLKEIGEAKKNPNGWVYRIYGNYNYTDAIPPEAIVGAWKVDSHGKIQGDFIHNKNFIKTRESSFWKRLVKRISILFG